MTETVKIHLSWADWAIGFLPVGLLLFIALPLLVLLVYRPNVRTTQEVPLWAGQELAKMGRIARREVMLAVIAVCCAGTVDIC